MNIIPNYINGKTVPGSGGRTADVYNPALGAPHARVTLAEQADVDAAVAAARDAFPGWSATPALRRARVLFKFKALLDEHRDEVLMAYGFSSAQIKALAERGVFGAEREP